MNDLNIDTVFVLLRNGKNICRFCFCIIKDDIKCHSIFKKDIYKPLHHWLPNWIKFNEEDFLPKLICSACYVSLQSTFNFIRMITESQDVITKYVEQKRLLEDANESFSGCEDNDNAQVIELNNLEHGYGNCCTNNIKNGNPKKKGKHSEKTSSRKVLQHRKSTKTGIGKTKLNQKCCSQEFSTQTDYYAHVRSHGVVRKSYKCSNCNKKYVSQFELEVHLRKHSGERPFSCSTCGKPFIDKRNLKKHEKIHSGNKTHECPVCHKKFLHLFTLKTHERLHSGEKPYVCENCGKSFNTSTELKIHNRTHTKEKPYKCNICEKQFSSKAALNMHMLVHTGEKKYGCSMCSRKCRSSYDLKTHMRCHSNERPYACKYANCDKKYKNSSQLNVHLRTHKGEKSHQCSICFKHFGESNTLRRHMTIHEKNMEKSS